MLAGLGPFVAEADQGADDGIEEIAEQGSERQNGEDQFDHWRGGCHFLAAFDRLI